MFSGTGWNHSCCHSFFEDSHEYPWVIFRQFLQISFHTKNVYKNRCIETHRHLCWLTQLQPSVYFTEPLSISSSLAGCVLTASSLPRELLHLIPVRMNQGWFWEHCWWGTSSRCFCLWRNSLREAGVLPCSNTLRLPVPHNLTPNLNSPCQSVKLGHSCSVSLFILNRHPCFLFPTSFLFTPLS